MVSGDLWIRMVTQLVRKTSAARQFLQVQEWFISGLVSNVVDGSADMIAAAITLTRQRRDFIFYLPIINSDRVAIFIRRQQLEEFRYTTFISAFTPFLWLFILIGNVFVGLWLYVTNFKDVNPSFGKDNVRPL